MTLQQLKYIIAVADSGSINEAAKKLFISQPSLSAAVRELENEIKITLFVRTSRGVTPTAEGSEFLGYARQVAQQAELIEARYLAGDGQRQRFSVSAQHYAFTANAFIELIKEFGGDEYEFTMREGRTHEIIQDVKSLKSELGVIYLSHFNEAVITRILKENGLVFRELFRVKPHVFISRLNPLAAKEMICFDDLEDYPFISFEQGDNNSFYFSEEVHSTREVKKKIKVTDRAALINLMTGVNGYTLATGVFPKLLHGEDIVARPLESDELIRIGIITRKDVILSRLGEIYVAALEDIAASVDESGKNSPI